MRKQYLYPALALLLLVSFSGCVSNGLRGMDTVVSDMHQRVTMLDEELEPSIVELNENTAALIQRVNENERQVRLLTSMVEENQHKLDKLLKMLSDLKATLYRHWGLNPASTGSAGTPGTGIQIVPPSGQGDGSGASRSDDAAAPPVLETPGNEARAEAVYGDAKKRYDAEQYAEAASAFSAFLKSNPRSDLAHKAQFWLGKCHLNQSQYSRAINAFESLRRDYPESSYIAFALHNQAVGHFRLGERDKAIALMEEVVANYPTSTAADHATRDLEQLRGRQ